MFKLKILVLLSVVFLASCGAENLDVQIESDTNCLFDAIHPTDFLPTEVLFSHQSGGTTRWNGSYLYRDYYLNIDSIICDKISLNLVMHSMNHSMNFSTLEALDGNLEQIRKSSPFYEGLPVLSKADKVNLLNTGALDKMGFSLSIIETDSSSILTAIWSASAP